MLDESAPTPHIDITSSALRLLLNFPIGVLKTKYQSTTKTRAKKVWEAYWYFPLDADSHLEFKKIHVVLVDNNEGFVAPAVLYCQAELHEEFTMAISAPDDAKDSFKSLTKLVPEGSEIHQALVLINMHIKTAHSLSKSANIAMDTADVTAGRSKSSSIPLAPGQQVLMPRKKRKVS